VQAVAYLELRVDDRTIFGVGMDTNIISASFKAILCGILRAESAENEKSSIQEVSMGQI
jgi:2-isopropylmalate synthase